MSKEIKPRVPAYWPIMGGFAVQFLGAATGSAEASYLGLVAMGGGAAVAAGDFICDLVEAKRNNKGDTDK